MLNGALLADLNAELIWLKMELLLIQAPNDKTELRRIF